MESIVNLYLIIDKIMMPLFRYPDDPLAGYILGTFVLSFASMIMGEYSMALAYRLNRDMIGEDNSRISRFQDLSFEALKAGNKNAFKACNGIANEAYGMNFFRQITLSAASLWPLFIALGWMQYRFAEVRFGLPFIGEACSFGYASSFIFCYIVARVMVKKLRHIMLRKY